MSKEESTFAVLHQLGKEIANLQGALRLLEWDQETYMPKGANEARSDQIALLSGIIHEKRTSKNFITALQELIDFDSGDIKAKSLPFEQQSALKCWRRDLKRALALPKEFVENFAKLSSDALSVWRDAKKDSNFALFAPYLEKLIDMSKEKGRLWGFEDPYDALLDHFEPGFTKDKLASLFEELVPPLKKLLKEVKKQGSVDDKFLHGTFDQTGLFSICQEILQKVGYDFNHGRLDISSHPFSTSFHPTDSRITTRFSTDHLIDPIMGTIHEAGHSLYEMALPVFWFGTPLSEPISMGMHESQSRFWETRIGLCKAFWSHFYPLLQKQFPDKLKKVPNDTFYSALHKVSPSFIRVEADEVTYPFHIILRFEIERGLFDGSIQVKDVPEVWNQKMKDYLGITPPNDQLGCLQDIHWAFGGFGYFPSYTLGNIFAAHLFLAFEKTYPDWQERVKNGDLLFIKAWLNQEVHSHGRVFSSIELLEKIYPKELTSKPYIDYLSDKYQTLSKTHSMG